MADDEIFRYLEQEFEWSRTKATKNALKHGVRFTEAATVLFDPEALIREDGEHAETEQRYTVVGHSVRSRVLFVVHVSRADRVRSSARARQL